MSTSYHATFPITSFKQFMWHTWKLECFGLLMENQLNGVSSDFDVYQWDNLQFLPRPVANFTNMV